MTRFQPKVGSMVMREREKMFHFESYWLYFCMIDKIQFFSFVPSLKSKIIKMICEASLEVKIELIKMDFIEKKEKVPKYL